MCLQRVGSLAFVHVERKGFQIVFFLRWIRDRRLRPLAERIVLDAVFFCRGDILRKSTGISVQRDARREHRIVAPVLDHGSFGVRFRRSGIAYIESNLILSPFAFWSHALHCIPIANALNHNRSSTYAGRPSWLPAQRRSPTEPAGINLGQSPGFDRLSVNPGLPNEPTLVQKSDRRWPTIDSCGGNRREKFELVCARSRMGMEQVRPHV